MLVDCGNCGGSGGGPAPEWNCLSCCNGQVDNDDYVPCVDCSEPVGVDLCKDSEPFCDDCCARCVVCNGRLDDDRVRYCEDCLDDCEACTETMHEDKDGILYCPKCKSGCESGGQ